MKSYNRIRWNWDSVASITNSFAIKSITIIHIFLVEISNTVQWIQTTQVKYSLIYITFGLCSLFISSKRYWIISRVPFLLHGRIQEHIWRSILAEKVEKQTKNTVKNKRSHETKQELRTPPELMSKWLKMIYKNIFARFSIQI